jgi:hypothetical protein
LDQIDENQVSPLLATLVGEDKKYKSVDDLAKAYAHADVFIEQLKSEKATTETEKREAEERAAKLEAQLEILNKLATNPKADEANGTKTPAVEEPKSDDIDTKIRATVELLSEEQKQKTNSAQVDQVLIEKFGEPEKATEYLKAKAAELGVGIKFLTDLAKTSPTAFYATVGLNTSQAKSDPAPRSTVNTTILQGSAVKPNTYAWYQQLRKENKALYNTARIQTQMHADASKPGFYD